MSRFLSWFILLPVGVAAIVFAVFNRADVTVNLWPAPFVVAVPSWVLVVAGCLLGFVLGGLSTWLAAGPNRGRARVNRWRVQSLERDLTVAQDENQRLQQALDVALKKNGAPSTADGALPAPEEKGAA